jgi:predicted transposase/invertase (TIGR01784 family)
MGKRDLSPLADPVFKRVFGEEKEILIDLINAVIELPHPVLNIEYLPPELLSEQLDKKTSIVDVRCTDDLNRHFIVEMQVARQKFLKNRVLFNVARVYGRQMTPGQDYDSLQPVYTLCLADHIIEPDTDRWKHKYVIVHENEPNRRIPDVEMHFIELSKCRKRGNFNLENSLDRWVKYLIDPDFIKTFTMNAPYNYPNLKKAVELLDESNYTEGQLLAYDRYLDSIRSWNSSMKTSYEEGVQNLEQALKDLKEGHKIEEVAAKYNFEKSYIEFLYQTFIVK